MYLQNHSVALRFFPSLLPKLSYVMLVYAITSNLINSVTCNVLLYFIYSYKPLNSTTVRAQATSSQRLLATFVTWYRKSCQ